jgi:hypothetical protein
MAHTQLGPSNRANRSLRRLGPNEYVPPEDGDGIRSSNLRVSNKRQTDG